jgi:hypothetical protein
VKLKLPRLCSKAPAMFLFALATALSVAIGAPAVRADLQDLTLQEYQTRLDELTQKVSKLADDPSQAESLRKSLSAEWRVSAGGASYQVSLVWLSDELTQVDTDGKNHAAATKDVDETLAQLRGMRAESDELAHGSSPPNTTNARPRLDQILSEREFRQAPDKSALARMWDQVQRWIEWLIERTIGRIIQSESIRTVVLYTILTGVFLIAAVWIIRSLRGIVRTEKLQMNAVFHPGRRWRDWAQDALTAAGAGDYRTAVHAAYWAGIFRLGEIGDFDLDFARTPREYLRALDAKRGRRADWYGREQADPGRAAEGDRGPETRRTAIVNLTRSMESSWYGYEAATEKDFDSAVEQLETIGCRLRSTGQIEKS